MRFLGHSLIGDLVGKLPPQDSVHVLRFWDNAHSPEIESVSIPACTNRGILVMGCLRVPSAGRLQKIKLSIGNLEMDITKLAGIDGTSSSMVGIGELILPPAVVEESKEAHHHDVRPGCVGQKESIRLDPLPVIGTMIRILSEGELSGDNSPEVGKIDPLFRSFHLLRKPPNPRL